MSEPTPVAPAEDGKKTSKISEGGSDATVSMDLENAQCYWNGQAFGRGDQIQVDGAIYECSFGCWVKLDD